MRLRVASTGGATGSGSAGVAARLRAVYSVTGSTTQPSAAVAAVWAEVETAEMIRESRASATHDAGRRSRFMVILLMKFVCSARRHTSRHCGQVAAKQSPHFGSNRDPGVISLVKAGPKMQ